MLGMTSFAALLWVTSPLASGAAAPTLLAEAADVGGAHQAADALAAQRAKLASELARVNSEIDNLKRAGASVGNDYRLRARMADAEALAKQLIAIDARLGIRAPAAGATAIPPSAPVATPADGPAELDAKADILADQSRRYRIEAQALGQRAREVRARQELRGRAADLERDPFAPMEGSKRRVATSAAVPPSTFSPQSSHTGGQVPAVSPGLTNSATTPMTSVMGGGGGNPTTGSTGFTDKAATATPTTQLRDVLDTATLGEIRRPDGSINPAASPRALERAAHALEQRAAELDARAHAMRTQAHPAPAPQK
jgi:hypothetical protein